MEIFTSEKFCILTPLSPKLDKRESKRIFAEIDLYSNLDVGLDFSFVQDCTIDFLEQLRTSGVSLFNINSDVFVLLNIMGIDIPIH